MYLFKHLLLIIDLLKGKGHKYIKRVPVGVDKKTGRTRYRYVYNVTHKVQGKHIDDHDNMKVNSKYMWHSESGQEVHVHVKKVNKDGSLVLMYDDGDKKGEEFTMSKKELAQKLREEHGIEEKFKEKREKVKRDLEMARKKGTEKQIKRLERELAGFSRAGEEKQDKIKSVFKKLLRLQDSSSIESFDKEENLLNELAVKLLKEKDESKSVSILEEMNKIIEDAENKLKKKPQETAEKDETGESEIVNQMLKTLSSSSHESVQRIKDLLFGYYRSEKKDTQSYGQEIQKEILSYFVDTAYDDISNVNPEQANKIYFALDDEEGLKNFVVPFMNGEEGQKLFEEVRKEKGSKVSLKSVNEKLNRLRNEKDTTKRAFLRGEINNDLYLWRHNPSTKDKRDFLRNIKAIKETLKEI